MSDIEKLCRELRKRIPGIETQIDEPSRKGGSWFLDLDLAGRRAVVEWWPERGFGVSARERILFGEGSDEIHPDVDAVAERLAELFREGNRTQPPEKAVLRVLRESRKLSQAELAEKLHVTQAAVSKMERRSDMFLSTLRSAVTAMGGELEVRARFPEGTFEIVQLRGPRPKAAGPGR